MNWSRVVSRGYAAIGDKLFFAVPNGVQIVKLRFGVFQPGGIMYDGTIAVPLEYYRVDYKRFISNDRYN